MVYYVHERLIRSRSSFFDATLGREWKERQQSEVTLPDDEKFVFSHYVQWLYTGKIPCIVFGNYPGHLELAKLYALAEKLMDKTCQDVLISAMVAGCRQEFPRTGRVIPSAQCMRVIYANTMEESPARQLVVDMYVLYGEQRWFNKNVYAPDFLTDLVRALLGKRDVSDKVHQKLADLVEGTTCS